MILFNSLSKLSYLHVLISRVSLQTDGRTDGRKDATSVTNEVVFISDVDVTAILSDVIRNIKFITKEADELIIRQDDQGDW